MNALLGLTFSLLFIIFSISFGYELVRVVGNIHLFEGTMRWLAAGFLSYAAVHIVFSRSIVLHVFAHELTHALWSALTGGRFKSIYISRSRGGYFTSSKTNFVVLLAPYFFPLYSIVLLVTYFIASEVFKPYLLFLIGFSLSFHIILSVYSIWQGQSDIKRVGVVFSMSMIIFMNIIIIGSILCYVAPGVSTIDFLESGFSVWRIY